MIAAACLAAAVSADPLYGYGYGYGLHQQAWPGVRAPGFEGTCYGCRPGHYLGKRSADAEPHYGFPYAYGAYGLYPYALSAGPLATSAGPTGVAGHPGAATSFVARSPQGLRGKRSAEPYYGYAGFYGHPYGYYGRGIAGHPGAATSFVARSPQGLGK